MILDIDQFVARERPHWKQLEGLVNRCESQHGRKLSLDEIRTLHFLYRRCASDLAQVQAIAGESALRTYLENLVARAYAQVQAGDVRRPALTRIISFLFHEFPRSLRRRAWALALSTGIFTIGALFGAIVVAVNVENKEIVLPFSHLLGDPSERVAMEEAGSEMGGMHATFSAQLISNNIQVSILCFALGLTFGLGTVLVLFYNGAILGAVAYDYIMAGESTFLIGWLLPHGSVEIPCILIAGQAGLLLASAMIGGGSPQPLAMRMQGLRKDLVALIAGVAMLLVWAGIVESFFSQYHEPVIPYFIKIAVGVAELVGLCAFLCLAGRKNLSLQP